MRGEVSAQRTEGSWLALSVEASVHLRPVQCLVDGLDDGLRVQLHIAVPKAQDPEASRPEKGIASAVVVRRLDVVAPVQLDDHTGCHAGKVTDVRSDRMLPAELEACQLPSPQMVPQESLGVRGTFAEVAGKAKHPPSEQTSDGRSEATSTTIGCIIMTPPSAARTPPHAERGEGNGATAAPPC
jgi:hypothetical protein